nr:myosin-2 heavy chain-like [Ipomoea batatas]
MAKRRREEADSGDGAAIVAAPATSYNSVFIDTDLDTHLAMMVSDLDTVSDLKKKIVLEHLQCLPEMGEITIHSVKVKRKGRFYHLPDSMLVRTAFQGTQRNWFLYVTSSISVDQISNKTGDMHDGNNQVGLLCIKNYAEDVSDYVLPDDPSKALVLRDTTVAVPADLGMDIRQGKDECHGDLSSAQKKIVSRPIDQEKAFTTPSHELKDYKSSDSSKGIPVEGPLAKRQKLKQGEDAPHKPVLKGGNDSQNFQTVRNENTSANDNEGVPVHIKKKGKSGARRKRTHDETGSEVSSVRNNKAKSKDNMLTEVAESGSAALQNEGENTLETRIAEDSMEHKQETLVVGPNALKESLENGNFRSDSEHKESKSNAKKTLLASDDGIVMSMHSSQNIEMERRLETNSGVALNSSDNSFGAAHTTICTQSEVNEKTSSRKSHFANSKECPPPVNEEHQTKDTSIFHPTHESVVSKSPRLKTDLPNIIEEQNLLPDNYVETVYSPKPKPSDQSEKVTSSKHLLPSSDLSVDKGVVEHDNKWKKKKKKSNARIQQESEIKHYDEPNCNTSISVLNFTADHATDEIMKDESSIPENGSDKTDKERTVPEIEADATNKVGNDSKVLVTCDLEVTASEICPPSDHVQADVNTKGGTKHDKKPKKKKSKGLSASIQFEPDVVNTDQATVLKLSTDDYGNDETRKTEITVPQIEADHHNMIEKEEGKLPETCDPDMKMPEMCLPSHHGNEETANLSSKLDAIQRTEDGNTERTKRKRKSAKKIAGKTQYKLEEADVDLVSGISSAAVNVEASEPVTQDTAKTEGLMPHAQTSQTTTLEKGDSSAKDVDMQSENCASRVCGKADMISEQLETVSRAELSNANATEKHENTGGSQKIRKSKKSLTTKKDSSLDPANVTLGVSPDLPTVDLFIDGSKDQSHLNGMEIKNASGGLVDTKAAGSHVEIDKVNESEAEHRPAKKVLNENGPLQVIQTGKSQLDEENTEKKAKRKKKRNSSIDGQSHSVLAKNDHEVGVEVSNDNAVMHHSSNVAEVSGTAKDDHAARVAVTDAELVEGAGNSGQAPGDPEDNSRVELQTEVSTDNCGAVNFRSYFVPGSQQGQGVSSDKVKKSVKSKRENKAGKKSVKGGLVNSLAKDENVNPEYKHSSSTELGKSKYDKQSKVKLQSNDNRSNTLQEAGNPAVHGSENPKDALASAFENNISFDESISTSSPTHSQNFPQCKTDRSQSGSNHKSLSSKQVTDKTTGVITSPSAALRDDGSGNYSDDNGAGNSDASTRTPSDSSSSGFSVGGSELSHHSSRNGANGAKRNKSHGERNIKSNLSSAKNLTMDVILRSSRRFKKAKMTATQLQLETDSKAIDFVPDSEPN